MELEFVKEPVAKWAVQHVRYKRQDWRSRYKHDVDEIVYRHAFRKLARRTQVIVQPSDETFRTRATHTEEVLQGAHNFCTWFDLNKDLTKAVAYGHDIGHPPFAHVGERTLSRLLTQFVERAVSGHGRPRHEAEEIARSFVFRHADNSRRILQRGMTDLSQFTLESVVGHGWSPWKNCSTWPSMSEVEAKLKRSLAEYDHEEGSSFGSFLKCYEAQAVALSDQMCALNSDVEDLVYLEGGETTQLRKAFRDLAARLPFENDVKEAVRKRVDRWLSTETGPLARERGWGRKHRYGDTQVSIWQSSLERVNRCDSYEKSPENPLAPAPEVAIALDMLERATRTLIHIHPAIRDRDAYAEAAVTVMFSGLLTLARDGVTDATRKTADAFVARIASDFESWRKDYDEESQKETPARGAISLPGMKEAAARVDGLWEVIHPAVTVVDYISEMTDRFVVHDVFAKHSLQAVLLEKFETRYEPAE